MKIKKAEIWTEAMPLEEPYTISYETYSSVTAVFIRLETDTGISGFGSAAPDYHVTGETTESVLDCLNNTIEPLLTGSDPLRYLYLAEKIKKSASGHRAARAAADIAIYDILGKSAGMPVWKLLGGFRKKIETSLTVGILPPAETLEKAEELVSFGAKILKIKGGVSLDEDIDKLVRLREKFGPGMRLRFDANQGYSREEAVKLAEVQEKYIKLELLEQPVSTEKDEHMGDITRKSSIPVMADESILGLTDAFHLVKHDLVDMVNIKLMKTGGITDAVHINSVGRAAGVEVMVGCMDESALGIAAGLHLALSRPNILYADLDGHFGLSGDPAAGLLEFRNGCLYPGDTPGFGWNGP